MPGHLKWTEVYPFIKYYLRWKKFSIACLDENAPSMQVSICSSLSHKEIPKTSRESLL